MSTKTPIEIEDWYLYSRFSNVRDHFPTPLRRGICLRGLIRSHPRLGYVEQALTSPIVKFDYRASTAQTESGTLYKLCTPDRSFVQWAKHKGIELNDYNMTVSNTQNMEIKHD